jgi:hypothetical protein
LLFQIGDNDGMKISDLKAGEILYDIIADYRRARLAGLPVNTVELFRQLDDALADVKTFVASEYRCARLAGLPVDIGIALGAVLTTLFGLFWATLK